MKIEVIAKKEVEKLYQWDIGRKLRIIPPKGVGVDEVHFVNTTETEAFVVKTKNETGEILADIPNILLQSSKPLKMYFFSEGRTLCGEIITIIKRAKPADYVYTETEVKTYALLEKRISDLEKYGGGGSGLNPEQLQEAVNKALEQAKASGEFDGEKGDKGDKGDKGEQGIQGEKGADGYTPQKNVDYFDGKDGKTPIKGTDYFTQADKEELVTSVLNTLPTWQGGAY